MCDDFDEADEARNRADVRPNIPNPDFEQGEGDPF